jgi:hypothetical protein
MDARACRNERAKATVTNQHLKDLPGCGIDIQRHAERNYSVSNDLRGDGEVSPPRIG